MAVTAAFETARLEDVVHPDYATWHPIRHRLGIGAFGVNAWSGADGAVVIPKHDESEVGHEELYLVVSGSARFTVDGQELDAPAGTLVFVRDPKVERAAVARQDGTTVLSIGGRPDRAFEVSDGERQYLP